MRVLYIVKEDPRLGLGHAPERARHFIQGFIDKGLSVTCAFPNFELSNSSPTASENFHQPGSGVTYLSLSNHRTSFERFSQFLLSHHEKLVSKDFSQNLSDLILQQRFDWIICEELSSAIAAKRIKGSPQFIYVTHNVESELYLATMENHWLRGIRHKNLISTEKEILRKAKAVFCFSKVDQKKLERLSGRPSLQLTRAGCRRPESLTCHKSPDSILFVGALNYPPNIEALEWFSAKIFPELKAKCQILVAGKNPTVRVRELAGQKAFQLVENPPSMTEVLSRGLLSIVPLKNGSGTRGKILESMAHGIPVVSTSIGAEGLDLIPEKDLVIADTPSEFAARIDWLIESAEERSKLIQAGLKAAEHFTYDKVIEDFLASLKTL